MSNLPAIEVAKRATHDTRNRVLLSKTKMTSIADASNRNRMTIAKWLDGDDMSLAAFVAAQQLSGGDPVKTLAHALADKEAACCLSKGLAVISAATGSRRTPNRRVVSHVASYSGPSCSRCASAG